jgi:hypothetical protein
VIALVALCVAFAIPDLLWRRIPLAVTGPALALAIAGAPVGLWRPGPALLAVVAFVAVGLPAGDQKAIAVIGGCLTGPQVLAMLVGVFAGGLLLLAWGNARGRPMHTVPFFPVISIAVFVSLVACATVPGR